MPVPPDDQAEVIAFLTDPATHGGRPVACHETHGAVVVVAGDEALKIKRAVRYPYMDLSSVAARHAMCEAELEVNRVFAPDLYLGTVAITRGGDGRLALGGDGEPVEWAVRMRRLPDGALLADVLTRGGIPAGLMDRVADAVAAAHLRAPVCADSDWAGRISWLVTSVAEAVSTEPAFAARARLIAERLAGEITRHRGRLLLRAQHGAIRRCHGDLHLGNVAILDGDAVLFDALEFDPALATIDVLYDLAFLLMDLVHHGRTQQANAIANRWVWRRQADADLDGWPLLPLYMGLRALIRAMACAQRGALGDVKARDLARTQTDAYLESARVLLSRNAMGERPLLVGIGGLSGTGKSTLAAGLAPHIGAAPGALHLRSDLERKALAGVEPTTRLAPETYTAEASETVYQRLTAKAARALAAGCDVIVDAVFAKGAERIAMEHVASATGARFVGIWLTAPTQVLAERVQGRSGDASDAGEAVVQLQAGWRERGAGWLSIDVRGSPDDVLAKVLRCLDVTA